MKLKITLKDPDGVYESIRAAAEYSLKDVVGLSSNEKDALADQRHGQIAEKCSPWIEFNEYVTIEIDTDSGTAVVCKV
jgi:hypothetical protein